MSRAKRNAQDARATSGAGAAWSIGQTKIKPPPRHVQDFLNKHVLIWLWNYLKVAFTPRYRFASYKGAPASKPGIYPLPANGRVSLVGDWGSGTESAYRVIDHVRDVQKPNITIHLGDIYYSGQVDEVNEYFLGPEDWYRAERSFALNANHEMYSGGAGYFEHVLPALRLDRSPAPFVPAGNLREARLRFERDYIAAVLQHHGGRMAEAAQTLGIQRPNLYRKARQLGMTLTRTP